MASRALQLSMARNTDGVLETRPYTAALMVKAWKAVVNKRLNRWVPWTGRRFVDVHQTSRRHLRMVGNFLHTGANVVFSIVRTGMQTHIGGP